MGIFRTLQRRVKAVGWALRADLQNPPGWLRTFYVGEETGSGEHVNERNALEISAVMACTRLLSSHVAMIPFKVYRREGNGARAEATDHPLYPILHLESHRSRRLSSYMLRETLMADLLLQGNAFAYVERDKGMRVTGLTPIPASWMEVKYENKALHYQVRTAKYGVVPFRPRNIWHVKGLSLNQGLTGLSVVSFARESWGLTRAAEKAGGSLFKNGMRPSGILEHPGTLSDDAYQRLKKSVEDEDTGVANWAKVKILEEGMKYAAQAINPQDAQFLETRKFQVGEIARWFGVPPNMIGDTESGASYASVEQQELNFTKHSLTPWLSRIEQEANLTLLSERDREQYFVEFDLNGLLRGAFRDRMAGYHMALGDGLYTRNEVRALENKGPVAGGDRLFVPANMVALGDDGLPMQPEKGQDNAEA